MDVKSQDLSMDTQVEKKSRQSSDFYSLEEEKLETYYSEDSDSNEEDSEDSEDPIEDEPMLEDSDGKVEFDELAEGKTEVAGRMKRACAVVVGSAFALSDLSKAQTKNLCRLINGLSSVDSRIHGKHPLHLQLKDIDKYGPLVEKELELIGSKIQTKSRVWHGHKTVNGIERSNDHVVMVSSLPLALFHEFKKGECYSCHMKIRKNSDARAFLQCEHSSIYCDRCINTDECPLCYRTKTHSML
jgi:hypothetical protein